MYHHIAQRIAAPQVALPPGMRVPFGWNALPVVPEPDQVTELRWTQTPSILSDHAQFRLTVAVDVREDKRIEAIALQSGKVLGTLDIRFAPVFQVIALQLALSDAVLACQEGMGLRMTEGSSPLWFLAGQSDSSEQCEERSAPKGLTEPALLPHLMVDDGSEPLAHYKARMQSLASIQQFGWMEGVVLDGLMELGYEKTAREHLAMYVTGDNRLVYEDPRSRPVDDSFYGIESTLPIAILGKLQPDNPIIDAAVKFMLSHADAAGIIKDGDTLSAEGSYTIAYPLAVIARQRQDRELADQAYKQLMLRGDLLWADDALCLRRQDDGTRTFRNWGRAYAWHMLGLARTYEQLSEAGLLPEEQRRRITTEWSRTMRQALKARNESHRLWDCFLYEPETGLDTSASAGIMAAIATARRAGLPAEIAESDWRLSTASLLRFLTPDGFMTGTAQSNKSGEALQRSGYRVISQMTMGLLGQLLGTTLMAEEA